ncbi:MAG TPA: hypothetical protein VFX74_06505, partial [Candidatus Limnocylindria bacterium]|nr:hypothetical protein [Candidatus Limnocylindria bacterium]
DAIEHDGFSLVDITSQCIENNGRRIGFASANEMLNFYRKTYKRAPKDADHLEPFQLGVLYPLETDADHAATNGNGHRPAALAPQPAAPLTSATETPGEGGATEPPTAPSPPNDDEKAQRRAESQRKAALMAQLPSELKLRVAKREMTLEEALSEAGVEPDASL